jgi:hypothetical protein
MVRQPRESVPAQSEFDSLNDEVEGSAGSRREFLQFGAIAAVGLVGACGTKAGDDDLASGGTGGTGVGVGGGSPMAGKGGTGTGGTGTAGMGTGTGGTGVGTGGSGVQTGGTGGSGTAGQGTGGTAQAGTGGTTAQAGTGGNVNAGGSVATGGAPPNGGAPPVGGSGGSGMAGMTGGGGAPPGMNGSGKENNYTPLPTLPAGTMGPSQKMMPDPFKFMDGTRISKKEDWERLRADLSAMLQAAVYGPKMPAPDKLMASISGTTVTVNMTVGSKTGSFTFTIKGGNKTKPTPGVIRCASSGNPFPSTVATIDFDEHSIAQENKMWPTTGLVTTLYGNTAAKSGSDICWAWGASRIIDALEQLGPDMTGVDTTALATTGCSFAGKGAFAMGAFDERVALVCPEEAGSGGAAAWRVSSAEAAKGQNIQEATEIVGEQNWQGKDFHDLFSGKSKTSAPVDMLIADQHFLVAICAPRACLIIDNDIDWLGPLATYAGGVIGKKVYQALGIADRCEVSVSAMHNHCSFPSSQQADLTAFINRFLLRTGDATPAKDVLNDTKSTIKTYTESDWLSWDTPTLSGDLTWDPFK